MKRPMILGAINNGLSFILERGKPKARKAKLFIGKMYSTPKKIKQRIHSKYTTLLVVMTRNFLWTLTPE